MIWDYPMWFYLPVFVYLNLNVMRNIILFFVTGVIATIGLFAALGMKTPWVGFAITFGGWLIYLWKITNSRD